MSVPPNSKSSSPLKRGVDVAERRASERFPFSAVTELVENVSRSHISARVSDISPTGCYLDVINVFPPGTKAKISIRHAKLHFEAEATVVYSLPGMGMGVTFNAVGPEMTSVLKKWISQVKGEITPVNETPQVKAMIQNYPRVERHILGSLIGLMMRKSMLTSEEGTALLAELLGTNQE
jgi:hypothetical protein